ncbi:LysR family transcriptional regulator [Telmatospirillum sp.]|uniref:LysR family transcriptional regulator n=1 Tax=Telmatospirillum sp. TaxID=2079197 RepID=UPI002851773A|nr:LysR family transcriptional regulator [Telmatospirillum sp.]MDR3440499.1 LysR family transcriptional regulator [Telmatospirillum sp.]
MSNPILEMHSLHTHIHVMNLASFDLNLLTVFDAVMQERSVTRAGKRVGLSQPAMSHALNRLRHMLKDDLFVRTPSGMVPTPLAEMLAQPLRNALAEMAIVLEPARFDPASSDKRFVLGVNNYVAVVIAPQLVAKVMAVAPNVFLDLRPSGTLDVADRLDHGDLDLTLGGTHNLGERFVTAPLLDESFVMVMRHGHPAASDSLSAESVAAFPHLEVSSSGDDTSFFDRWFDEQGLTRRITLRAPYLSAAQILVRSDLVATLSRRIAQEFVRNHPLQICELPCESPRVRTVMQWHKRLDRHPAHRWLRDLVVSTAKAL